VQRKHYVILLALWISRKCKPDIDIFLDNPIQQFQDLQGNGITLSSLGGEKRQGSLSRTQRQENVKIFVSTILCDSIARLSL